MLQEGRATVQLLLCLPRVAVVVLRLGRRPPTPRSLALQDEAGEAASWVREG